MHSLGKLLIRSFARQKYLAVFCWNWPALDTDERIKFDRKQTKLYLSNRMQNILLCLLCEGHLKLKDEKHLTKHHVIITPARKSVHGPNQANEILVLPPSIQKSGKYEEDANLNRADKAASTNRNSR